MTCKSLGEQINKIVRKGKTKVPKHDGRLCKLLSIGAIIHVLIKKKMVVLAVVYISQI